MTLHHTRLPTGIDMAWRLDDHTDGWTNPPTAMLLHGIAETGEAFNAWVPGLSRHCRVMRVDLRGYGGSSQIADGEALDLQAMSDDIDQLVSVLGLGPVHLVGAKLGAQIGLVLAQRQAPWLASLSLAGVLLSPGGALAQWVPQWLELVERGGVEGWARQTMPGRMGSALPPEGLEWWARFMGATPAATVKACFRMLPALGEPARLEHIVCPTQVLVAEQPGQAGCTGNFDQRQALADVERYQRRIPASRLCRIPADSYHIAATHPDACARAVLQFMKEISK